MPGKGPLSAFNVPGENSSGDCFVVALENMMGEGPDSGLLLCHGVVSGQGQLFGIRYPHAWNESGDWVIDTSNGNDIYMPKEQYYSIGNIDESEVFRYTYNEMARMAVDFGTYGPWEPELDFEYKEAKMAFCNFGGMNLTMNGWDVVDESDEWVEYQRTLRNFECHVLAWKGEDGTAEWWVHNGFGQHIESGIADSMFEAAYDAEDFVLMKTSSKKQGQEVRYMFDGLGYSLADEPLSTEDELMLNGAYTVEELEAIYNDNQGDPVIDMFDSFDEWFEESRRNGLIIEARKQAWEGWDWEPEDEWDDQSMYELPKYDWHEIPGFVIDEPDWGEPAYVKDLADGAQLVIEQTNRKQPETELYSWEWFVVSWWDGDGETGMTVPEQQAIEWSGVDFQTPEEAAMDFERRSKYATRRQAAYLEIYKPQFNWAGLLLRYGGTWYVADFNDSPPSLEGITDEEFEEYYAEDFDMFTEIVGARRILKAFEEGSPERDEYLRELAFEYDVPEDVVFMLADLLGPNEDYDGLVTELEDYETYGDVFAKRAALELYRDDYEVFEVGDMFNYDLTGNPDKYWEIIEIDYDNQELLMESHDGDLQWWTAEYIADDLANENLFRVGSRAPKSIQKSTCPKTAFEEGSEEREEYLKDLAFEYDVPEDVVFMLADMLGPNEDLDGLVTELEDYMEEYEWGGGYFGSHAGGCNEKSATRKFTYAEMEELDREIEGRELHNRSRLKAFAEEALW